MKAPYTVLSPHGNLTAFSMDDARAIIIFPDSIIVRNSDGVWMDKPLCIEQISRLKEIHNLN